MAIRFLVVDDAAFIRDMLKKQLRDRIPGAQVFDAPDGHRAIAQLKKQRVDVIFSDWEMPGMSGEELLRWVRAEDVYKTTPFIMVTSRGDKDHVIKAIQAGVSDFITKPFSSDELIKKTVKQLASIGKSPTDAVKTATAGDRVAFASVEVLTGGGPSRAAEPAAPEPRPAAKKKTRARAQLRFPQLNCPCVVTDISLQALHGLMQRGDSLPALFDQAVVDIELDDGSPARLNGYVSQLAAGELKADTQIVKISVRFVDNDPDKFEALSRFIAKN